MKFPVRNHNNVEFLLDGVAYFEYLNDLINELRSTNPHDGTYLRLAFWEIASDLKIGGQPIVQALKDVADAGHPVDVILWCPARLDVWLDKNLSQNVFDKNTATANAIAGYDSKNGGRIRVLLEYYNGWNGSSTHQKIVIAAVKGKLTAVIGGLNLAPFYVDNEQHDLDDDDAGVGGPLGLTIHDVAIAIRGPAAVDIETEWLRRYKKRFYETQLFGNRGAPSDPPDKDPTEFDALFRANPAHQHGHNFNIDVQIATTNSESYLGRETDIQELLVQCIRGAQRYIYLDGFVISDPTLVGEIRKRLRQPGNRPQVIILVPRPYRENTYPFDYLNYISAVKIGLDSCTAVKIGDDWIERDRCSRWKIREDQNFWSTATSIMSLANRWLQDDRFSYTLNGVSHNVALRDIEDFREAVPLYSPENCFGKQGIYIHSKLALFDDSVAVIGSANFSFRSQVYDGEISAFVRDPGQVIAIRERLFTHWGLDEEIKNFDKSVVRSAKSRKKRRVRQLRLGDFPKISPLDRIKDNPLAGYANIPHTFI